jgi:hypothetical protein
MIVYRQPRRDESSRLLAQALAGQVGCLANSTRPDRAAVVHALIDAGEFAAAVADARSPDRDDVDRLSDDLLTVTLHLAAAADALWTGHADRAAQRIAHAQAALAGCAFVDLPARVTRGVSEGFAYYSLGPEMYADAARRWAESVRPHDVSCIGLRTIGLTLAASAAAGLQSIGVVAQACSVRPRGHPFDRRVSVGEELARRLTTMPSGWCLIVDEGPGISGSSLAGAAHALSKIGVADHRIVLMPAYTPDVARLATRAEWQRHPVWPADYHQTWIASGRLRGEFNADDMLDIAAGAWRRRTALDGVAPAVHPQHERRKYRVQRQQSTAWVKFAGYGHYGATIAARAAASADAGWSLPAETLLNGWIRCPWIDAPFGVSRCTTAELTQLADYLTFIARTRATSDTAAVAPIAHMAVSNIRELWSDAAARAVEALLPTEPTAAVLVDGRLRPHEWWRQDQRLKKSDGLEHCDDHFFPGPCDIAWDIAGVVEEWQLEDDASAFLIRRFVDATADRSLPARLPFYRAAYLAFRAAYTKLSVEQLQPSDEAGRFAREHVRYKARLQTVIACAS